MKRHWLTALAGILFAGSLVWWFLEKDHKEYWLLLLGLSVAVAAFSRRVGGSKERLEEVEGPPKP